MKRVRKGKLVDTNEARPYCVEGGESSKRSRIVRCFAQPGNATRKCQAIRRRGGHCRVLTAR